MNCTPKVRLKKSNFWGAVQNNGPLFIREYLLESFLSEIEPDKKTSSLNEGRKTAVPPSFNELIILHFICNCLRWVAKSFLFHGSHPRHFSDSDKQWFNLNYFLDDDLLSLVWTPIFCKYWLNVDLKASSLTLILALVIAFAIMLRM